MNLMEDIYTIRRGFSMFIILGGLFTVIGVIILVKEILKRKKCKDITNGTIIDIAREASRDSDGHRRTIFYPIFEYNVCGNVYTKKSNLGSSICNYHIGQTVEIMYNSENPNEYYVKGKHGTIVMATFCTVMGIIFTIVGITTVF